MRRNLMAGLGILVLVAAAGAQAPESGTELPPGIAWQPDYDQALDLARELNRPIMVAFILMGESANEEVIKQHFRDRRIIEQSRKFVCLLACRDPIETVEGVRADGTRGPVSREFGSASPVEIQRVEQRARYELTGAPMVSCPQFVFLLPDGKTVVLRHVWMLAASELLKKMQLAYAFFDPSTAPAGFKELQDNVTRLLDEADGNNQDKRREALRTLAGVDDPRVTEFLIKQTRPGKDSQKRLEAITLMGTRGNAKVLPALHELVVSGDNQARVRAAVALSNIGMQESLPVLLKALGRERLDQNRSHLMRALVGCGLEASELEALLLKILKGNSQLDRITALYLIAGGVPPSPALVKAIVGTVGTNADNVRIAAYHCIGTLEIAEAKPRLKSRLSGERGASKAACLWALARLGESPTDVDEEEIEDPTEVVLDMLPDNYLYDGSLEDPGPGEGRRNPGGGRGGGRGGRGGRR